MGLRGKMMVLVGMLRSGRVWWVLAIRDWSAQHVDCKAVRADPLCRATSKSKGENGGVGICSGWRSGTG